MYSKLDTILFIEKCFGDYQLSNAGLNVNVLCPICKEKNGHSYEKKKLVIRSTDFALHCWVCGYKSKNIFKLLIKYKKSCIEEYKERFYQKSSIHDFIGSSMHEKIESKINSKIEQAAKKNTVVNFFDFQLLFKPSLSRRENYLKSQALKYLKEKRKLTDEQIFSNSFGLFNDFLSKEEKYKFENRVIMPSFNKNFEVDFYVGRSFIETDKRSKYNNTINTNEIIFNELFLKDSIKEFTLVEGPFDYVCSPYQNTIPLFGSTLSKKSKLYNMIFEARPNILRIALDKAETEKREAIAKTFGTLLDYGTKIKIVEIKHDLAKDFAELQEMNIDKLSVVEEINWYPKTKKEKLLERLNTK